MMAAGKGLHVLVLFDIDGTLVDCGGSAGSCFSKAFREVFGVPCSRFAPKDVAGLTDAAILDEVIRRLDLRIDDFAGRKDRAFEVYARKLAAALERRPAKALPGARRAVEAVRSIPGCAAGLLTGSTEATAAIKLSSAGIDPSRFACGAYSEDGATRESLPPAAQRRFAELFGATPAITVVVGDTPKDAQAALIAGCKFIGVATGHYDRATLEREAAGPVLDDLSRTDLFCAAVEKSLGRS